MNHHTAALRERVLASALAMLERLRIQVSTLPVLSDTEYAVLKAIERPQQFEVAAELTNFIMAKLGYETAASNPRFDKTHRALAKKRGRPPRGLKLAGEPTEADA